MATPTVGSNASVASAFNFSTTELQPLTPVSVTSSGGSFTTNQAGALDCMIFNNGTVGAYVVFSMTASPTATNIAGGVAGTPATFVAPGAYIVIQKGRAPYFAAITDSGTTTLLFHAGRGA